MGPWEAQIEHVSAAELDLLQPQRAGLRSAALEEPVSQVDAEYGTRRPNLLSGRESRCAAAATDIEHVRARLKAQAIDGLASEALPERVRGIVVQVCGCVEGGRRGSPCSVRRAHDPRQYAPAENPGVRTNPDR
jgi:hypothetical protein